MSTSNSILLITYYWPPAGGPGVRRWLKLTACLAEMGWEPHIFFPDNPILEYHDESLVRQVHPSVVLHPQPVSGIEALVARYLKVPRNSTSLPSLHRPYGKSGIIRRLMEMVRVNFFVPDTKMGWVRSSLPALHKLVCEKKIRTIITTGPPHSMHMLGWKLKRSLREEIYWVSDFRDLWVEWEYLRKLRPWKLTMYRNRKMQRRVLKDSNLVLTVSENWVSRLRADGGKQVRYLSNGFDPDDFSSMEHPKVYEKFVVSHMGKISRHKYYERYIFAAIGELARENADLGSDLIVQLAGPVGEVGEEIRRVIPPRNLRLTGYVSHSRVVTLYDNSFALLLLTSNSGDEKGHFPLKFYEYLGARRHILAITSKDSEPGRLIEKYNLGVVVEPEDTQGLKDALVELHRRFKNRQEVCAADILSKYDYRILGRRLALLLDELGEGRARKA